MKVEYPQYNEGAAGPSSANSSYADEIPSNRYVVGNKNSQFLYDQESEGPYQEMSKGASLNNRYLEKIAVARLARDAHKMVGGSSTLSKIGLGVSLASLGTSAANYNNGRVTAKASQDKAALERKSLTALNKINNTLSNAAIVPNQVIIKQASGTLTREEEEARKKVKAGAGGLGVYYGMKAVNNNYHRGNLTGRETLYHGSTVENTEKIKREGIRPNQSSKNVSELHGLKDANKDLSFATHLKSHAHRYSIQQRDILSGKYKLGDPKYAAGVLMESAKRGITGSNEGISKINMPTWKEGLKSVENPEYTRYKDNAFAQVFHSKAQQNAMKHALQDTVHTAKGGIGKEHIIGTDSYKRNSASEIKDYIKSNKGRFAKGVGKTLGGAGAAILGAHTLYGLAKDKLKGSQ